MKDTSNRGCEGSIDIWMYATEKGKLRFPLKIYNEVIKELGVYLIEGHRFWIIRRKK